MVVIELVSLISGWWKVIGVELNSFRMVVCVL